MRKKTLLAIAAAALGVGGALAAFLLLRTPAVKVAARSEVIALWKEQGIAAAFEENLDIRIRWIDYGSDTDEIYARVQQDMESEKLPDAYLGLGLGTQQLRSLADQNALLELGALLDELPHFRQAYNSDTSRAPDMRIGSGIYSFPSFNENLAAEYPQKAWINAEWLAAAKLKMPATPDALLEVLRKFKTLDPNGNGIADEVPLGAAYAGAGQTTLGFLIQPFMATDYDLGGGNYLNVENGKIYAGVTDPKFRSALQYLHTLYQENMMDADVFTQGMSALAAGDAENETYGVILAQDIKAVLQDPQRAQSYVPLPPLELDGHSGTLVRRSPVKTGGFLIPAGIKETRRQRALRLGDAMLGESGTLNVCYGPQGQDDFAVAVYGALQGEVPYWLSYDRKLARDDWQGYLGRVTQETYLPVGQRSIRNALPELVLTREQTAELAGAGIYRKVSETLKQETQDFVTGKKDIEQGWNAYIKALETAGLGKIVHYTQEACDARH